MDQVKNGETERKLYISIYFYIFPITNNGEYQQDVSCLGYYASISLIFFNASRKMSISSIVL
jgi:hypothetical protein